MRGREDPGACSCGVVVEVVGVVVGVEVVVVVEDENIECVMASNERCRHGERAWTGQGGMAEKESKPTPRNESKKGPKHTIFQNEPISAVVAGLKLAILTFKRSGGKKKRVKKTRNRGIERKVKQTNKQKRKAYNCGTGVEEQVDKEETTNSPKSAV